MAGIHDQKGGLTPAQQAAITKVAPAVDFTREVKLLTTYFGRYPCIGCGGPTKPLWCNGGLPQLANYTIHKAMMERDMASAIPDPNFAGYIVHDYEAWSPPWGMASAVYRNASIALARAQSPPGTPEPAIEALAERSFDTAALEFLTFTINTTKALRPKAAGVGFYGYPHHTYWGNETQQSVYNDALMPLWRAQTALHPSIYLPYGTKPTCTGPGCATKQMQDAWVDGGMNEAARISQKLVDEGGAARPILPYSWYRYHDGEPKGLQLISDCDTTLEFVRPFNVSGVQAVIIWGEEANSTVFQEVIKWFGTESAIFGGDTTSHMVAGSSSKISMETLPLRSITSNTGRREEGGIARDATIPPWQACGL